MTIRKKIIWITTVWLISILICINFIIYYLFIHIATDNEREMIKSRVDNIIESVSASVLMNKNQVHVLSGFLPDNSMLQVINRQSQVVDQISNDADAVLIRNTFSTQAITTVTTVNNHKILVMKKPIAFPDGTIVGTLVMAEKLVSLQGNIQLLIELLVFSSIGAVLLCIMGGIFLSKAILRPITGLIHTMEEVERSMAFRKIPISSGHKDELAQLGATFNRMMERIKQSFARQQQFVSDASHELKTPLTIIESYTNLLKRWGRQDQNVQEEAIQTIHEESVRMKQMIHQMLTLAASETTCTFTYQSFDLVELARDSAQLFETMNSRTIQVKSPAKSIKIWADREKIKQLLLILIDNAVKYSEKIVEIYMDQQPAYTTLSVTDYGIGIPEKEIPFIFERFYRVDKARHRKTGGTGLGLSIAKAIVMQHQGTIAIKSIEGKGSKIMVKIPNKT
ncbi:HAMP domain-containing histidine kinase [Fodinisporobacter ferrooxydans]|uniref:Signal transduction histidine-protein kinase ArlS n=1 Tax=Fodinisporobacter ferrooxydans TaxID=2901836 RepID=A0ABY4CMN3_9BACL|nr:HAMP domain-containing histidine kinase [Alicyclobacillaceae bacterium MYW30-H2]